MFDRKITGGIVYDGKGSEPFRAEVGVAGDRIVAVGERLPGATKETNALGKVVCPGFIDIHSHSDFSAVINGNLDSKVRQGVTTELVGNCGFSACPILNEQHRAELSRKYAGSGMNITWRWPEEYFAVLERRGIALNIAILVGHGNIRTAVMGRSPANPREDDLNSMKKIADQCLREGAFGMSTGLIYPPGTFSTKEEIIALLSTIREHDALYTSHIRNEGERLGEAVREAIECAESARVRLEISHLKAAGKKNWPKIADAFEAIESARERGLDVTCDRYPYIASSTTLDVFLPDWAYEGGDEKELARLSDPRMRAAMARDILTDHPEEDFWSTLIVSCVWSEELKELEGKTVAAIAEERREDPCEVLFDIILKDELRAEMVCLAMSEENLEKILRKPYAMIGSDGAAKAHYGVLSAGKPHPRSYGTFPRVFARYVRRGVLDLPTAIAKMTSMPARKIGLEKRGEISEGSYADLVIFDPDKIRDVATFDDPHKYPEGIELVMVNGKVAVENGEFHGVLNGKVLKKGMGH